MMAIPPWLVKSASIFFIFSMFAPSSPEVGSSKINILGFLARAHASTNLCFCPPDNDWGWREIKSSKLNCFKQAITFSSLLLRPDRDKVVYISAATVFICN